MCKIEVEIDFTKRDNPWEPRTINPGMGWGRVWNGNHKRANWSWLCLDLLPICARLVAQFAPQNGCVLVNTHPTTDRLLTRGTSVCPQGLVSVWQQKKTFFSHLQMQFLTFMDFFLWNLNDIEVISVNVFHVVWLYLTTDQYFYVKIEK